MLTGKVEDKIKFAVIGCGHIGKRHATIITQNPECELVALCDTGAREGLHIEQYAVPYFMSLGDLLSADISMDVVCIATPNGLHEEQALAILGAGYHVVIEKPMALTSAGCRRIIAEAEKKKKQVFCVMQNRYSPVSMWMKDIVEKYLLGDIYMVQINCYWNRDERYYSKGNWHGTKELDGGVLFTQFSHFIDTLLWVFGNINNISSRFSNFRHRETTAFEDSGFVVFDMENGGMGSIGFSTALRKENMESSIIVIAEKGTVKIGGQYMNEIQYCNIDSMEMPRLEYSSVSNHDFVFKNVLDVVKARQAGSITSAGGLKVVETIERIYKSVQ